MQIHKHYKGILDSLVCSLDSYPSIHSFIAIDYFQYTSLNYMHSIMRHHGDIMWVYYKNDIYRHKCHNKCQEKGLLLHKIYPFSYLFQYLWILMKIVWYLVSDLTQIRYRFGDSRMCYFPLYIWGKKIYTFWFPFGEYLCYISQTERTVNMRRTTDQVVQTNS